MPPDPLANNYGIALMNILSIRDLLLIGFLSDPLASDLKLGEIYKWLKYLLSVVFVEIAYKDYNNLQIYSNCHKLNTFTNHRLTSNILMELDNVHQRFS